MCFRFGLDALWHHKFHQTARYMETVYNSINGEHADTIENEGYPGVVRGLLQAIKRRTKGEIAENVERGPVAPGSHVQRATAVLAVLVQPADE